MEERILDLLENIEFKERNLDGIMKQLGLDTSEEFKMVMKALNALEDQGKIVRSQHNLYYLPKQIHVYIGTLSMNKRGFGFVRLDEEHDDIFIGKHDLKDALEGDIVLVELKKHSEGQREEGIIKRVIKRGQTRIVGELKKGKRELVLVSDDILFDKPVYIDQAHSHGAVAGHKVVAEIKTYKPYLKGNVVEIIGHKNDPGVDVASIVYQHEAHIDFPKEVLEQVSHIPNEIDKEDIKSRVDLRNETIVTIDGDDAKDLDDAISLKKLANGHYQLGVHIADVSYYVEEGTDLDKEAYERATSIYLVDRVIPMLPHKLSNGICSLNPHVDRFTISCLMEINHEGEVISHEILPTVIHSTERMTYRHVNEILGGNVERQKQYHHVKDMFFLMQELSDILIQHRKKRGAIDFDTNEAKVIVDQKGIPTDIVLRERGVSERMIESFMLVANETVAEHFKWLELPFIYRVHENPKLQKLQQFSTIAKTLGYTIKGSLEHVYPHELSAIVDASIGTPEHQIISTLLLRCMAKASYDEQCLGHFGLADEYYTHFTSPIRRYPDLMVHRLIRKYLFEKKVDEQTLTHYASIMQEIAEHTSFQERKAIDIEREVDDMKMAEYMESHIDEEFTGIVSSITNFGMFVELDNTVEGLVRMEDLSDDYYFYDERSLQLIGQRTGKRFKMSDEVKVRVKGASKKEKTIDFEIVGMKSNKKKKKTVIIDKHRKHQDVHKRKRQDQKRFYRKKRNKK